MLLLNVNPFGGHANGGRYNFKALHSNLLLLKWLTDDYAGTILALPKMPCSPGDSTFNIQRFTRNLFPLKFCSAISVKNAQGQSFSGAVGPHLSDTGFLLVSCTSEFPKLRTPTTWRNALLPNRIAEEVANYILNASPKHSNEKNKLRINKVFYKPF